MSRLVCAVDLGGTKINTGIVNDRGEVIKSIKVPTDAHEGSEAVVLRIKKSIYDVMSMAEVKTSDLFGIGVGSPGPLDPENGVVISPSNFPNWDRVPVVNILKSEFGLPVKLNNDANAAALGEYQFGSGRGTRNFVYITVSTGIGGGVIIDGKLYNGANCNAAEVGHMTIDFRGPKCNCGNFGCFEAFASGTALARFAKNAIQSGRESLIDNFSRDGVVRAEHVFEAAKLKDELAMELIENEALYLGVGISNIMSLYNPQRIAIGGGISNQWDMLCNGVLETIRERTLKPVVEVCDIVKSQLRDDIGILGAAAICFS